jgi:hypothetical protein
VRLTPSTLYWDEINEKWTRFSLPAIPAIPAIPVTSEESEFCSFIVVPNSQIELSTGLHIRDYMEWCSPDTEEIYTQHLKMN